MQGVIYEHFWTYGLSINSPWDYSRVAPGSVCPTSACLLSTARTIVGFRLCLCVCFWMCLSGWCVCVCVCVCVFSGGVLRAWAGASRPGHGGAGGSRDPEGSRRWRRGLPGGGGPIRVRTWGGGDVIEWGTWGEGDLFEWGTWDEEDVFEWGTWGEEDMRCIHLNPLIQPSSPKLR